MATPNTITDNPNASVAGAVGAAVTIGVWAATALGVDVPPEIAAAITTLAGTVVLFIGNRSKKGV